jgi:DNA-directed RNA polymerase subunit RPC12/RpoP
MTEHPRRPTLKLKSPPRMPLGMPIKAPDWKCRPCGTVLQVATDLADDQPVRCPGCNARLGLARDFRSRPPNIERLRARLAPKKKATAERPLGGRL